MKTCDACMLIPSLLHTPCILFPSFFLYLLSLSLFSLSFTFFDLMFIHVCVGLHVRFGMLARGRKREEESTGVCFLCWFESTFKRIWIINFSLTVFSDTHKTFMHVMHTLDHCMPLQSSLRTHAKSLCWFLSLLFCLSRICLYARERERAMQAETECVGAFCLASCIYTKLNLHMHVFNTLQLRFCV